MNDEMVDGGSGELPGEMICGYPVHRAASVYPLMEGQDWANTLASIRKGMKVQEPVVFLDGVLLDGRNRLRAVELIEKETGEKVSWEKEEFRPEWGDVVEWIENRNSRRRNLTVDQLAAIAVALHSIREHTLAAERKKQSQFGCQVLPKDTSPPVTPNPGSPLDAGNVGVSDAAGGGKPKIKLRNPTTAATIATKAGPGVKTHHIESVLKIEKEVGPEAVEEIRLGKKTITEIKKIIPKAAKPPESLDTQVEKRWAKFKQSFAVADLAQVRVLLRKVIKAEMDGAK